MQREFRLQKVLDYRARVVDVEKSKLTEMNARLLENRNSIMQTQQEIEQKVDERQTSSTQMLIMYDRYIQKLNDRKTFLLKVRKQLEAGIENQKKKVMAAIDRHKIMEKLKEKHVQDLKNFLNKEEMKLIDELAITRSARNDE